jgi:hypothetical protein
MSSIEDKMAAMLTSPEKPLLEEIEAFLNATGLGASYLGKRAVGNSELVGRLRNGGRVWPETDEALRDFMAKYRESKAAKSADGDETSGAAA